MHPKEIVFVTERDSLIEAYYVMLDAIKDPDIQVGNQGNCALASYHPEVWAACKLMLEYVMEVR